MISRPSDLVVARFIGRFLNRVLFSLIIIVSRKNGCIRPRQFRNPGGIAGVKKNLLTPHPALRYLYESYFWPDRFEPLPAATRSQGRPF